MATFTNLGKAFVIMVFYMSVFEAGVDLEFDPFDMSEKLIYLAI